MKRSEMLYPDPEFTQNPEIVGRLQWLLGPVNPGADNIMRDNKQLENCQNLVIAFKFGAGVKGIIHGLVKGKLRGADLNVRRAWVIENQDSRVKAQQDT